MVRAEAGALFYLALALFGTLGLLFSQTAPIWHETVSVYPEPAVPMLAAPSAEDPGPRFLPGCADPGPIRLVVTNMRPQVALCVHGRQYPLQIMSYASGLPYWVSDLFWPLHRGRVFWLRGAGILLGLLTIVVIRRLLTRYADPITANVAALCVAVSPAFLFAYPSLLHYEVLPWLALAAALEQLSWCRGLRPGASDVSEAAPSGRVLAAAALVGLALLANLKAVFLIAPLALMALRAGVRFTAIRWRQWCVATVVAAAILLPSVLGNSVNAGADLSHQFLERWKILVAHMSLRRIAAEVATLVVYWGDTVTCLPLISGDFVMPSIPAMLVTIVAFGYCVYCGVSYLWHGRCDPVPAACGLMFLTFIVVSGLLYDYYPSGQYIPLTAVFGIATAATAVNGSRGLASRLAWPAARTRNVVVGLVVAAMLWGIVGRGTPAHVTTMSINAVAENRMAAYLMADPDPEVPVFVTTYILAGVAEAITGGAVRTIKAHNYLNCSTIRGSAAVSGADTLAEGRHCIQDRFARLFDTFPGPLRFLLPLEGTPIDDALAGELGPSLEAAAAIRRRAVVEDVTFSGWGTGPVLRLVRVGAAAAASGSAP